MSEVDKAPPSEPTPSGDPLAPRSLFAKAFKFSGASILGAVLGIPVSLFVARRLGPESLGLVQSVLLAYAYGAFVRLGAFEAAQRELVHASSQGRADRALRAQNTGVTVDLVVTVLTSLAFVATAWSFKDRVRLVGFALAPLAMVGSSLASFLANLHLAHLRFRLAANAALLRGVGGQILVVLGVIVMGPYGLILAPIVADWALTGFFRMVGPRLGLALSFERAESQRLVRAGFPLGAIAVVYWSYRLAGSTAVALWTNASTFGLYAFAAAPVSLALRALNGISTVLAPTLWGALGTRGSRDVAPHARRLILVMGILAGAMTNAVQAGFGPIIASATPKFIPAIRPFEILAFNVVLFVVPMVSSLTMDSLVVGKQWPHLWLWAGALGANLIANRAVIHLGLGISAIAWNDVIVQMVVAFALLCMTRAHLDVGIRTAAAIAGVLAWTGGVWLLLRLGPRLHQGATITSVAADTGLRLAIVMAAWAPGLAIVILTGRRSKWAGSGRTGNALSATLSRPAIVIRPALREDALAVWTIANEPTVRENSFDSTPIPYYEHMSWYEAKVADLDSRIWVAEQGGRVVGLVRYDCLADGIAEIGLAVAPSSRGQGLGAELLRNTVQMAARELGVRIVRGVVKADNTASTSTFLKAGFGARRRTVFRGHNCIVFECNF